MIQFRAESDQFVQMLAAQGGYPQPGAVPAGYPPYPYPMMTGYPQPPATGKGSKAAAGGEPATKGRKRRKRIPQGGPKKPATSFVLFSNTVREQVKEENPGLSFLDLGKKLGEMWREMDPAVSGAFSLPLQRFALFFGICKLACHHFSGAVKSRTVLLPRQLSIVGCASALRAPCVKPGGAHNCSCCRCERSTRTARIKPRRNTSRRKRSGWRNAQPA